MLMRGLNINRDVLNIFLCLGIVSTFHGNRPISNLKNSQLNCGFPPTFGSCRHLSEWWNFSGIGKATNLKVPSCHPDLDTKNNSRKVVEKGIRYGWSDYRVNKKNQMYIGFYIGCDLYKL